MQHKRILLVDDDAELAELVAARLRRDNFEVDVAFTGRAAIEQALREPRPELVILDVGLPDLSGFDVLRAIRPECACPIMMLTARDDDFDQVAGLELGADDYVKKPVHPRVLLARVAALLRIASRTAPEPSTLVAGTILLDPIRREVSVAGAAVVLTTAEFDLLALLMRHAGEVLSRTRIYRTLHGIEYDGIDRVVDVHITHLRQKLGDVQQPWRIIRTVRGVGYQLVVPA